MTPEQKQTLLHWQGNFQTFLSGHYEASAGCQRMNLLLGIPVVVLSAAVGTSVFAAMGKDAATWVRALVACVSVLTSVLAAVQTFLRFSERSEKHRIAGAEFAALHKEVDQLLVVPPRDDRELQTAMKSLRVRWDKLSKECPTIPVRIMAQMKARFHVPPPAAIETAGGGTREN